MYKTQYNIPYLSNQYQYYTTLLASGEKLGSYRLLQKEALSGFVISATNINLCKPLIAFSRHHQATV